MANGGPQGTESLPVPIHKHDYTIILGADGHAAMYGGMAGYIRSCRHCGDWAPDYLNWLRSRVAQLRKDADALEAMLTERDRDAAETES